MQNLIKNEQTIRHASKEAIDKLLEDPKFKDEYDKFVESMKEIEDVERRKSEERSEPSDSSSEQSIDEAEVVGG
ncbi:MAG TPA: hypothetical protein VIS27_09675 [Yeosuana sp.]